MKYKLKMLPKKIFYDTLIIEVYILPDLGGQAFFLKFTLLILIIKIYFTFVK